MTSLRATERLELIHLDIYGPINPASNPSLLQMILVEKNGYISCKTSQLHFDIFRRFKVLVNKDSSCQIQS